MQYYIAAFKTGAYPKIKKDRIFLWGRLYPAAASSPDPVDKPTGWQWVSLQFHVTHHLSTEPNLNRRKTTYGALSS